MVEQLAWAEHEAKKLRALRLAPVRNPRPQLRHLITYFKNGGSLRAAFEDGHELVSKGRATKIRDSTLSGELDWVLQDERSATGGPPNAAAEQAQLVRALSSLVLASHPTVTYSRVLSDAADVLTLGIRHYHLLGRISRTYGASPDTSAAVDEFRAQLKRRGVLTWERFDPAPSSSSNVRKSVDDLAYDWIRTTPLGDEVIQALQVRQ